MTDKEKSLLVAEAENVEAIRDFFKEWWTVEQLYEAEAKASLAMLGIVEGRKPCPDEIEALKNVLQQHMIMVDHIKPFDRKDGEV